jgi:hypothetical protein
MNSYSLNLQKAKNLLGSYEAVGRACGGLSGKAVIKWHKKGKPPRTEYTGETNYAALIEKATGGEVNREDLLPVSMATHVDSNSSQVAHAQP